MKVIMIAILDVSIGTVQKQPAKETQGTPDERKK